MEFGWGVGEEGFEAAGIEVRRGIDGEVESMRDWTLAHLEEVSQETWTRTYA